VKIYPNLLLIKDPIKKQPLFPRKGFAPDSIIPLKIKRLVERVKDCLIMKMPEAVKKLEPRLLPALILVIPLKNEPIHRQLLIRLIHFYGQDKANR